MMGSQVAPAQLFYDFCLDDHVPDDHLLRRVDQFLDLESVRSELKPFYSTIGRPSIAPELMMRMLLVGYCMGIRSERRLCEKVHLNLAYRWFCRLGLDGKVPDHSTFSRNRHGRFRQSDILRHLFETVVKRCLSEGLVGGEGFAVDASLIAADANKQRSIPGDEWRAADLGAGAGRAVREYLATLDDAAFGAASEVTPKFISPSDPAAQWTGAHKGHAFFAYATNYLIDTDHGVILDVEATRAIRQAEVGAARTMRSRRISRCSISPTGRMALSRAPTSCSIRTRTNTPARVANGWCSSGAATRRRAQASTSAGTRLYRASQHDCKVCELKPQCCPNMPSRKIPRDLNEDARDVARAIAETPEYERSRHRRKKVEMLFAHHAFCGLGVCDCAVPQARAMSSSSPLPPRISEDWQSSDHRPGR